MAEDYFVLGLSFKGSDFFWVEAGDGVEDMMNLSVEIDRDDIFAGLVVEREPFCDIILTLL